MRLGRNMELKLQQAIVATRAGRTDIAQHLLTQLLRENPEDANAWFLMGHIVDTPDRQALYLQKAVALDPDHAIAKQQLMQIEEPPVLAPVIPPQESHDGIARLNGDETSADLPLAETAVVTAAAANELPEWLQDLDNKQLEANSTHDEVWQESAGVPVRATPKASTQIAEPMVPQNRPDPAPASSSPSGDVWLVRILVIMVIVAAIVLSILVLLILI